MVIELKPSKDHWKPTSLGWSFRSFVSSSDDRRVQWKDMGGGEELTGQLISTVSYFTAPKVIKSSWLQTGASRVEIAINLKKTKRPPKRSFHSHRTCRFTILLMDLSTLLVASHAMFPAIPRETLWSTSDWSDKITPWLVLCCNRLPFKIHKERKVFLIELQSQNHFEYQHWKTTQSYAVWD